MIPHKITIAEAKKIDLGNTWSARDCNQKKSICYFLFSPATFQILFKRNSKDSNKSGHRTSMRWIKKITWKADAYLLKQRGNTCWPKKKDKSTKTYSQKK